LNFDLSRLEPDPIAAHFVAAAREIASGTRVWSEEVEASYALLVRMVLTTVQKLAAASGR